jgi:hypothetical protein
LPGQAWNAVATTRTAVRDELERCVCLRKLSLRRSFFF